MLCIKSPAKTSDFWFRVRISLKLMSAQTDFLSESDTMNHIFLIVTLLLLSLATTLRAQEETRDPGFNLLTLEGLSLSDVFTFDAAFEAEYEIEVPIPFEIVAPRDDRLLRIVDGRPSGGAFVQFTYALEITGEEAPVLVENLQITGATIPLYADHADPAQARQNSAAALARDVLFPRMVADKSMPEILTIEAVTVGGAAGVQLIGQFIDPLIGPTLLRAVILPHPDQERSLVAVALINLSLVPVRDAATLAQSRTGRMLASWRYL